MTASLDVGCALPDADAWRAAAVRHEDLFAPLAVGARVGLIARTTPSRMLVWKATAGGIETGLEPFAGYAASAADIVLAADDDALNDLHTAVDGPLIDTLRARIRSGHVVCYLRARRCDLEERGFDELLEALGFAFMGACR